jgi:hypothetical protein
MVATAWLLFSFYDRFWYPPDEGNYAHVAQRLLQGETLNLQVQDVHPGYISFVNAAAMSVFGSDLVSLRYPLVFLGVVQAAIIFLLFPRRTPWHAATATVGLTSLSTIQFLNPTAHWYCLALVIGLIAVLRYMPRAAARLIVAGALIGTIALFRQLTGFIAGIGTVAYLFWEMDSAANGRDAILARIAAAAMMASLSVYLYFATDVSGIVLFGLCPLVFLGRLIVRPTTANADVVRTAGWLAAGTCLAVAPLLVYHLAHGSLGAWAEDVGPAAVALTRLDFFSRSNFAALVYHALQQTAGAREASLLANGAYWTILPLLAALNGCVLLYRMRRSPAAEAAPLPVLACFYAIVSIHFQIPVYLYYSAALSLASLLWFAARATPAPWMARTAVPAALMLAATGVFFHAGQPASRSVADILQGRRSAALHASTLPHCSLRVDSNEGVRYAAVVDLIRQRVPASGTILAIPSNAELYFLSQRKNAFRFFNTALGVRDDEAVETVQRVLRQDPPALITFNPADKYNTARSLKIMDAVKERYVLLGRYEPFEVYVLP